MTAEPLERGEELAAVRELSLLSVIAPVFDEQETLPEFHRRVVAALGDLPFELVLVDDGSSDSTPNS